MGNHALHEAALNGYAQIVECLLLAKATARLQNSVVNCEQV